MDTICGRARGASLRQPVEFLDLRKADVDLRTPGLPQALEHRGEAVQRLRPEYQVDVGRAGRDAVPFLARDAAADSDHHVRSLLLEKAPFPEQREHLFLRLLPHRAGIDQEHVGLRRVVGPGHPMGCLEHVLHLAGVVLVHLTTECLYVNRSGHEGAMGLNFESPLRY